MHRKFSVQKRFLKFESPCLLLSRSPRLIRRCLSPSHLSLRPLLLQNQLSVPAFIYLVYLCLRSLIGSFRLVI